MIDEKFLNKIGLSQDQKRSIIEALQAERLYHTVLCEEGVSPIIALKIIDATQLTEVDATNELLLRLKVRETWKDFIVRKEASNERRSIHSF